MTELCHTGRGLSEEFDDDFQNRLAAYFCRDHEFLTRAGDLVAPNQFSNAANAILVNMVSGYFRMYKSAPSSAAILDMLKRAKRDKTIREEMFPDVVAAFKRVLSEKLSDTAYMVDQVATFAKSVAFDDALIKAAEMKEKGDFQGAMAIMAKVQQIGSNEATGIYDYYASAAERYKAREYEASDDYVPVFRCWIACSIKKVGRNVRWCSSWGLRNQVNRQRWGSSPLTQRWPATTFCIFLSKCIPRFSPIASMHGCLKRRCQSW